MRRALLLIFVLILTSQTLNTQLYTGTGNKISKDICPLYSREGKINYNDSREVYKDGIVGSFDNFTNMRFPTGYKKFRFCNNSYQIIKIDAIKTSTSILK